ncbi:MAG: hypothetical protein HY934_05990 [Candidatus Firestonebacteria bacterium]|nr:hypothetical protein [Candidatus Firestonebacteria bacterium]
MNLYENMYVFWNTSIGRIKIYSVIIFLISGILKLFDTSMIFYMPFLFFGFVICFNFLFIHTFILKNDKILVARFFIFKELQINTINKVRHTFPKTERYILLQNGEELTIDPYFNDQKEVLKYILDNLK